MTKQFNYYYLRAVGMSTRQGEFSRRRLLWVTARRMNGTDFDEQRHQNDQTQRHQQHRPPILLHRIIKPAVSCTASQSVSESIACGTIQVLDAFALSNQETLHVSRHRLNTYGRPRAFAIAGPSAWNSLPDPVCNPNSTEAALRCLLKTFLFAPY